MDERGDFGECGIGISGGGGGIRTHGAFRLSSFQDWRNRPLYHPSREDNFSEFWKLLSELLGLLANSVAADKGREPSVFRS